MNKDLLDDRFGRFREIPLAIAQKGHTVIGLCLSYNQKTPGWYNDGPVLWESINATRAIVPGLIKYVIEVFRYAKRSDVIWACSDSFYGVIGCMIGRLFKRSVVFDIYDNFGEFFVAKLPVAKQLYHWAIRQSDAITCLSTSFVKYLDDEYGRIKNVYPIEFAVRDDLFKSLNKQDCRKVLGLPPDALLIGTAGDLSINRDVHLLIDAFEQLRNKYPNMQLALAGPLDSNLGLPNNDRVHYMGVLPFEKVPHFMNCLDVAVICYANDEFGKYCFPQKTREFMACGIPMIAANVGSLKDLLKNHPEWLYEPGNVQSLMAVLEKRISEKATNYPSPPTWNDLAKILERIMLQIQNEKRHEVPV